MTCLYFTGFILVALIFRFLQLRFEVKSFSLDAILRTCFSQFYNFDTRHLNRFYAFQILCRALVLMLTYWCGIKSIYYASLANINFGIVSCCFICSIIINVTFGLLCFGEKMTWKMVLGIVITITGIMWISLAKGAGAIKGDGVYGSEE